MWLEAVLSPRGTIGPSIGEKNPTSSRPRSTRSPARSRSVGGRVGQSARAGVGANRLKIPDSPSAQSMPGPALLTCSVARLGVALFRG